MSKPQQSGYVLVVTNDAHDASAIKRSLSGAMFESFEVEWVRSLSDGMDRLDRLRIVTVILDLCLPDSHGIETFDRMSRCGPRVRS